MPDTRWSLVSVVGRATSSESRRQATEELIRAYWKPVYVFFRRRGMAEDAAMDLTQGFFLRFVEGGLAARAEKERGRFRSFLLGCAQNVYRDHRDREGARKRNPGSGFVFLDQEEGELVAAALESAGPTPEEAYEVAWARIIVERVVERLERELLERREPRAASLLLSYLLDADPPPYRISARRLGVSEASLKMKVSRLRRRMADLVRAEVTETVSNSEEVDDELRSVLSVIEKHKALAVPKGT